MQKALLIECFFICHQVMNLHRSAKGNDIGESTHILNNPLNGSSSNTSE